ncbi:hypothetical protein BU26DRAFT_517667 [Trematosphaeria pertusa]|uniref:Heterokaryon incompatibility domain-containing protein n=1 Tax=Trematosphaeria pertusa TaxID=390896 RepID=A0A6A6ILE7_9PLEO|nr:uncharacterized protein BU26DRAFT_517667 [Trematosphaeria pertusa]KAF2250888.1 hypothetical protein BU26DRAFT_517667 [Trematosphaeria pertusa]
MQTFCHSLRETGFKRAIERWSVQLSRVAPLVHDDQLGKSTLSDSLIRFRHWQNGDPRDTVYGLLALTGIKKGQFEIKPDYTRPVLDVLVDAVEYAIEVEESLALVAVPWAPSIPGLPTWIVPLEKEVGLLEDPWGGSIPPDLESTFYPLLRSKVMKAQILRPSKEDVFGTRQSSGYVLKVLGLTLNGFLWLPDVWDNSSLMEGHFHPYLPGIQDWEDRRPSDRIVLIPGCQRIVLLRQLDDGFVLVGSLTALAGEAILSYMRKQELDQLMSSPKETFIIY